MTYILKFQENSLYDFNEGLSYYKKISKTLAERFFDEFWICVADLKKNPNACQIRYLNIRIIQIQRFPFTIHFLIENNVIYVQRVLHDKRYY
ncbi:hypothetical protein BAA08_00390 [Bizionia sp. APA-3]|nr:hypothetical protein BAA08_00390 [Bizionia sp. APA-3]